jgi:translation initiation factor IF-2
VAINKVDKDSANVDRVKSDLAANGVEIEDYGGDVQVICVSGKTGKGMSDLEDSILTLSEMLDIRAETDGMAEGWVLESSIKPIGRVATVLVKRGTLRPGDHIVAGRVAAKIRLLRNEAGIEVDEAPPGTAVEILGWKEPPDAGDQVLQAPDEDKAKTAAHYRQELREREENIAQQLQQDLENREKALAEELAEADAKPEDGESASGGIKTINFMVKGDVHGSVEAVCAAVLEIGNNEVRPRVLQYATGQITESDVEHASISGSTILNFNNPIPGHIKRMAEEENVKILDHNVIYHLAEAVRDTLSEHLTPLISTRVTGEAEILQVFPINIKGRTYRNVAGCRVRNGQVVKSSKVRVMRDGEQIYEGMIPLVLRLLRFLFVC